MLSVRGFGEGLFGNLVASKRRAEGQFRFDPNTPFDPQQVAQIHQQVRAREQPLLASLIAGADERKRIKAEIERGRAQDWADLQSAHRGWLQAEADYHAARLWK